jgi:transcriptional regulator GlxA family with amidase domain
MQISIVAFDRFTDIDVFMPWDLLFRAKSAGASDWDIRILGKTDHVTSVAGLKIPTHGRLEETKQSGVVIFASGVGIEDVLKDPEFLDALHLDEERQLIGSMCAGAVILAEKGLLKGRKATTYPTYFKRLATYEGVEPVEEAFVPNGNVATAGGCLAAQLLCGWIMEKTVSAELADAVLASILPVGQGCKAFAGWGDPAAAKKAAEAAALKAREESPQAAE